MKNQDIYSIQNVISFIEENYKEGIDVPELEAISKYSYQDIKEVFENIFKNSSISTTNLTSFFKELKRTKVAPLKVETVLMENIKVYFKGINTSYDQAEIDALWKSMGDLPPNSTPTFLGLIVDSSLLSSKSLYRFEAAIHLENNKLNLPFKSLFGGNYLRYKHEGSYALLEETYRLIFQDCLFYRKKDLKNSPIIEHYYQNDMNTNSEEEFLTYIYIPLK